MPCWSYNHLMQSLVPIFTTRCNTDHDGGCHIGSWGPPFIADHMKTSSSHCFQFFAMWCNIGHNWDHHIGSWGQLCWPIAKARGVRIEHWFPRGGRRCPQMDRQTNTTEWDDKSLLAVARCDLKSKNVCPDHEKDKLIFSLCAIFFSVQGSYIFTRK